MATPVTVESVLAASTPGVEDFFSPVFSTAKAVLPMAQSRATTNNNRANVFIKSGGTLTPKCGGWQGGRGGVLRVACCVEQGRLAMWLVFKGQRGDIGNYEGASVIMMWRFCSGAGKVAGCRLKVAGFLRAAGWVIRMSWYVWKLLERAERCSALRTWWGGGRDG